MEIDLRGKRPRMDFDRLYPGDIMPMRVLGPRIGEESEIAVRVETISPLAIRSGAVRINHDGESTRFVQSTALSPYVLELAVNESPLGCSARSHGSGGILLEFSAPVDPGDEPTLDHSELGELDGFVRRVSDTVFAVKIAAKTFALAGSFEAIEEIEVEVEELEEGDDETRAEFSVVFSGVPEGGFFRIGDSTGATAKLHHSASAWEIEKALAAAGIGPFRVYSVARNPSELLLVAESPGAMETPVVETRFAAPSGFAATLDLSELTLRASLAGVEAESAWLSISIDDVTVFSDLLPLMRLFDGGVLSSNAGD